MTLLSLNDNEKHVFDACYSFKGKFCRQVKSKMPRSCRTTLLYVFVLLVFYVVIDISGIFRHTLERDYRTEFSYPLDIENFPSVVERFRLGEPIAFDPINLNYSTLKYLNKADNGCEGNFRLLILVKSAPSHFDKRKVIRATWGYPKRFFDVPVKTVFLLGELSDPYNQLNPLERDGQVLLETSIQEEIMKHNDIVRGNFTDSYYNNTMKTMMGMRWANEICPNFRFVFFVDDDMYVSVKNLLKFVRNPTQYPEYWEEQKKRFQLQLSSTDKDSLAKLKTLNENESNFQVKNEQLKSKLSIPNKNTNGNLKNSPFDFDIDLDKDAKLYAGYVFFVPPHRHKVGTKWFLPLSEYPFDYFPPYVPAGAIVLSKPALLDIYYASYFTKHFRFDDIFVALCAKKMKIEPYHNDHFRFWPSPVKDVYDKDYEYVVAAHGYNNPEELRQMWNIQKSLGRA